MPPALLCRSGQQSGSPREQAELARLKRELEQAEARVAGNNVREAALVAELSAANKKVGQHGMGSMMGWAS